MEVLTRNTILALSIVLEAALLLASVIWMQIGKIHLLPRFQFDPGSLLWGLGLSLMTSTLAIVLVLLGKRVKALSGLKKMSDEFLFPLVSVLNLSDIAFLSLLSGFCEEVLFRGIMQAQFGLLPASIIFGLFHDPTLKQKAYVILAMSAGFALGFLYQQTGNLWACILAHAVHNFVAMTALRYFIKKEEAGEGDA